MSRQSSWLAVFLLLPAVSPTQVVRPGVKAPPIVVSEWVKGHSVKSFEKGKTYVLEFWATWCIPCIQAMPHLSELAKKYEGKVVFVGVDVREQGANIRERVKKFVKDKGDQLAYSVCIDQTDTMLKTWLLPSGGAAIPATFVVDDRGTVLWIGQPLSLDPVLESILQGTFDLSKSEREFQVRYDFMRRNYEVLDAIRSARELFSKNQKVKAMSMLVEIRNKVGTDARFTTIIESTRLELLAMDNRAKALAEIDQEFASNRTRAQVYALRLLDTFISIDRKFSIDLARRVQRSLAGERSDIYTPLQLGDNFIELGMSKAAIECLEMAKRNLEASNDFDAATKVTLRKEIEKSLSRARKLM